MVRRTWLVTGFFVLCLGLPGGNPALALPEKETAKAPATSISVYANQSILVDAAADIKRVSIARPDTADVTVVSPRQMVVIGKSAGTTTLVYWSHDEVPTTLDIVVRINLDMVKEDLRKIAPDQEFEVTAAGTR